MISRETLSRIRLEKKYAGIFRTMLYPSSPQVIHGTKKGSKAFTDGRYVEYGPRIEISTKQTCAHIYRTILYRPSS